MSAEERPTSYAELIDVLDHLPLLVRETRRRRGQSLRAAAAAAGMSFSTVTRVESGEDMALSSARSLLVWLGARDTDAGGSSGATEDTP